MSAKPPFTQEPHKLLVIPGPIEVADDVLYANAHPSMSHVSPDFIPVLGDCIRMIREVVRAPSSQPFIIAGSGTLGWDQVASNLVEPGDDVLVITTGYFGDGFADCLKVYGANVTQLTAPLGEGIDGGKLEKALSAKTYKAVTFTHVDTSTGVLNDAAMIARIVKAASSNTLVVADCVCSVASETIEQEKWNIDIVLTASQKGLGTPPGLSILTASPLAIEIYKSRSKPVTSYYASWDKWLPIMVAYEGGTAAYFATPPVNLVYALNASLSTITSEGLSLDDRLKCHREVSKKVRSTVRGWGLSIIAKEDKWAANGMTAVYTPEGIATSDVVSGMLKKGVVIAAGLHKDIKTKYFRLGHMGLSVVSQSRGDIDELLGKLKETVAELGVKIEPPEGRL